MRSFDQENVPGFVIDNFVNWSMGEVWPKSFSAGSNGTRHRSESKAKWALDEYFCKQDDVKGAEITFHNVRLVRTDEGWSGLCDEGEIATESSGNKVMKAILTSVGLSTARSAVQFWNVIEQESAAGV